ncbi:MAG TPA: hypothetical protein PLP23_14055 [Panacibacter sp.]|nr:hypothetical protein [Panacibacter sp.]
MFRLFKRKEITINNKQELIATLTKIVELLRDNGFNPQADAVRKPLHYLYQDDTVNFIKFLKTVDIWGGSGSAWEVYGFETRQQEREFESCFVHLAQLLKDTGIKFKTADTIANIFEEDLQRGD